MTKIFRTIFHSAMMVLLATLLSCKYQPIYNNEDQVSNSATIRFAIDWTQANIVLSEVSNLSIYAYAEDLGSPYVKISGNIDTAYINLPSGVYSLLIFNDAVEDILGVSFTGSDSFGDFYAQSTTRTSTSDLYYSTSESEVFASKMGRLASWSLEGFEVTSEMISCSICEDSNKLVIDTLINATPSAITRQCEVSVTIENLNNAQIVQATLIGFASGAYVASGETILDSEQSILYSVDLNSYSYSNESDGVVEGETTIFGLSTDTSTTYQVVIDIILGSGELSSFTRDVTEQMVEQSGSTIYIDLSSDDDKIVLPESSGTGFGVDGWGNNQQIELL